MSWWRKEKIDSSENPQTPVTTIPEDFYAGKTPDIVFQTSQLKKKQSTKNNLTLSEKKALDKATQVGAGAANHPVVLLSRRKTFIWILGVVFIASIVGTSVYFFIGKKSISTPVIPVVTTPKPVVVEPTTTAEQPIQETPTTTASTTKSTNDAFNTVALDTGDSVDTDGDGLSDLEEDLFKTDPNLADSDQDKYTDSHEVYNLYNPAGKEPQKIIDSGLVTNFINPTFGYQVYVPVSWAIGNVDPEYRDVLFSTFTGDYVRMHVFAKAANETFPDFMARILPNESVGNYVPFETRFKESGFRRSDYMVYVWFRDSSAVVMAYNIPPGSFVANYRTVIKMMARSFRFGASTVQIAPQVIESPTSTPAFDSTSSSTVTTTSSTVL